MNPGYCAASAAVTTSRTRWARLLLVAGLALIAAIVLAPISRASAADITSRVTKSATVKAGSYDEWAPIRVDLAFSVASANTGDTFKMPLDKALNATKFVPMVLKDPAGATVANVVIQKDSSGAIVRDGSGNAVLLFTFTNYVATHRNITGSAFFSITFDHARLSFPGTSTSMTTSIYGTTVTITAARGIVGDEFIKYGNWRSPNFNEGEATALNPDGSSANPGYDIIWTIQLQGGAQNTHGGWTRVTITDTPAAGSHFECPLSPSPWSIRKDPSTSLDRWLNTSTPKISVAACSRTSLTLVVTKAASDTNIYRVRFPGWIDGAPLPAAYGNTAQLRYEIPNQSAFSHSVSTSLARVLQGGQAVGDTPTVLPPGTPKLRIAKRPLAKVARTGAALRWRIVVRNTGTALARNVRICDVLRDGQAFPTTAATYRIGTARRGVRLSIANGQGCITIPRLAVRASVVVVVTTQVPASARTRVRNTAIANATSVPPVRVTTRVPVIVVDGGRVPSPTG